MLVLYSFSKKTNFGIRSTIIAAKSEAPLMPSYEISSTSIGFLLQSSPRELNVIKQIIHKPFSADFLAIPIKSFNNQQSIFFNKT